MPLRCSHTGLHQRQCAHGHPFSPEWYVGGSVLVSGLYSSIVGLARFQLQQFTLGIKELAEWFGLELARLVVDECLLGRRNRMAKHVQRFCPSVMAIRES